MPLDAALPGLEDAEWEIFRAHLPAEPAQAEAMSNREFVEAVLWTLASRKADADSRGSRRGGAQEIRAMAHAGFW